MYNIKLILSAPHNDLTFTSCCLWNEHDMSNKHLAPCKVMILLTICIMLDSSSPQPLWNRGLVLQKTKLVGMAWGLIGSITFIVLMVISVCSCSLALGFPCGPAIKSQLPPAMRETWVPSLGQENPPKKGKLTTPVFWPGEFHGRYSPWGGKESDRTEWLAFTTSPALASPPRSTAEHQAWDSHMECST